MRWERHWSFFFSLVFPVMLPKPSFEGAWLSTGWLSSKCNVAMTGRAVVFSSVGVMAVINGIIQLGTSNAVYSFVSHGATASPPPVGQGLLIIDASWAQTHTPQLVGLLWTSNQHNTSQHRTVTRDKGTTGGIPTRSASKRAAADPRLRPHGHRNRSRCSVGRCI